MKVNKEVIERLKEIRRELTEIYMKLGNLKEIKADSVLSEDITFLEGIQ